MFLIEALTHFVYPLCCLHCRQIISGKEKGICAACFEQIEWLDHSLACRICGKPKRLSIGGRCAACIKKPVFVSPYAACFIPYGPAWSLFEQIEESTAKLFASLMILKWKELPWPMPDVVVPMPCSRLDYFVQKRQPSFLLAKAVGKLMGRPFLPAIKTVEKGDDFSYRGIKCLADQKVLLLVDVLRGSDKTKACQKALKELFPKTVYTLALFDSR